MSCTKGGSIVFDLGLPRNAAQQLSLLLEANSPQLRLLGVQKVFLEKETGQIEEWVVEEGQFKLVSAISPLIPLDIQGKSTKTFTPIPGMWRFHVIYMTITLVMAWSAYPFSLFASLLVISGACGLGMVLAFYKRFMATQILALTIGLGSPIVIFAKLLPVQTVVFLSVLVLGFTLIRRSLF